MEVMSRKRNRHKQTKSTSERLLEAAAEARRQASLIAPGRLRQELLRRAREAETAAHLNEWLTSPGLRPPK
jgi:hypothetical protein